MTLKLNSMRIESASVGSPKVCMLHGLMGSLRNWIPVGKALARGYEVHLIDLRNHGASPWSTSMAWADLSADLLQYVECFESEEPFHLLGHSFGGKVAMHFATAYPERVASLVVVDIAAKAYPPHYKEAFEAMLGLSLEHYTTRQAVSEALAEAIPDLAFRESMLTNLHRSDAGFSWKPNLKGLYHNLEAIRENPLGPEQCFLGRTLLIKGEHSDFVAEEDLLMMRRHFPNLNFALMEGVGHNPHAEARSKLVHKLIEWL